VGLKPSDIVVKISSREMLAELLQAIGFAESELDGLYVVLDKRNKLNEDAFKEMLSEKLDNKDKFKKVLDLMSVESIEHISELVRQGGASSTKDTVEELKRLIELLNIMGVGSYCQFDIGIVRGLAYYTGIVFEIYDRASELRAIGGGGRYDDLLKLFGGPDIPATGLAIGDCVLGILLEKKGLLQKQLPKRQLDYFVAFTDNQYFQKAMEVAAKIRLAGFVTNFSYKPFKLGKQLKQASEQNAKKCVIIGSEIENNQLAVKDMLTGEQQLIELEKFLSQLKF
jgi:histidyl-tRNA synthetase